MGRIDYYDDPSAPSVNALMVAVNAVVADSKGRLLLERRGDNGRWGLPGGGQEFGESVAACARREVQEETGYHVQARYVVGVYSDPLHVIAYDDGEVRQEFAVCVACELLGGELAVSRESFQVAWMTPREIAKADMHPRGQVRVNDYLAGARGTLG